MILKSIFAPPVYFYKRLILHHLVWSENTLLGTGGSVKIRQGCKNSCPLYYADETKPGMDKITPPGVNPYLQDEFAQGGVKIRQGKNAPLFQFYARWMPVLLKCTGVVKIRWPQSFKCGECKCRESKCIHAVYKSIIMTGSRRSCICKSIVSDIPRKLEDSCNVSS